MCTLLHNVHLYVTETDVHTHVDALSYLHLHLHNVIFIIDSFFSTDMYMYVHFVYDINISDSTVMRKSQTWSHHKHITRTSQIHHERTTITITPGEHHEH